MDELLTESARAITIVIEAMAVLIVAWASAEAFVRVVSLMFQKPSEAAGRAIYVRYLRWLVAGLTFQLAADIVHTAVDASWQQLAQVAAVAAIRAFTNFFLERDLREAAGEPRGATVKE
jgi:uncharacterized membrane protein